ncbi:Phytochrome-like protein cph1 [compost metagenome]
MDGCLRCEVSDTGIGIPADQIERLFQRFSQLQSGSEKGGTGLGLSICRAIVEAHEGSIGVTSEPGVGSVFWFTIPAA